MKGLPQHPFWAYSLALYEQPGVADACLRLQERLGADVNLLLFGCWVAASGSGRLSGTDWQRMDTATADWRGGIVQPLRAIRRRLKTNRWAGIAPDLASALRHEVQRLELRAEHAQQLAIANLCPIVPDPSVPSGARAADTAANLENYISALGAIPGTADGADTALIADAACRLADSGSGKM